MTPLQMAHQIIIRHQSCVKTIPIQGLTAVICSSLYGTSTSQKPCRHRPHSMDTIGKGSGRFSLTSADTCLNAGCCTCTAHTQSLSC